MGNMEKKLRFHMTPHLLSITFRITTDYKGLNLELKKNLTFFAWSWNARRLHRDCIAYNLYGNNFNTQHRVRDQTPCQLDLFSSRVYTSMLFQQLNEHVYG